MSTPTKRKADSEFAYIHKVTPKKKNSNCSWYDVYIQTEDDDKKKIRSFNISAYDELARFAKTKSPVKILTKQYNDAPVFNESCRVYGVSAQDVQFQYKEVEMDDDPESRESKLLSIKEIKGMEPNQGFAITLEATLLMGDADYQDVNTQNGQSQVKTDCFLQDASGHFPFRIWKSTAELVSSAKTYRLTNIFLRSYKGDNYLSTSRYTEVKEIQQKVKKIKEDLLTASLIGPLPIGDFSSVRNICLYYSCLSCKKKIQNNKKESTIACPHCSAMNKVKRLTLALNMEVQFMHENQDQWATVFKSTIEKYVDVNGTIEEIGKTVLNLEDIEIMLNTRNNIITNIQQQEHVSQ